MADSRKKYTITPKNHPDYKRVHAMVEKWITIFQLDKMNLKTRIEIKDNAILETEPDIIIGDKIMPKRESGALGMNTHGNKHYKTAGPKQESVIELVCPIYESTVMHELMHSRLYFSTGLLYYQMFDFSSSKLSDSIKSALLSIYKNIQEYVTEYYVLEIAKKMHIRGEDYQSFLGNIYTDEYCNNVTNTFMDIGHTNYYNLDFIVLEFFNNYKTRILSPLYLYTIVANNPLTNKNGQLSQKMSVLQKSMVNSLKSISFDTVLSLDTYEKIFCDLINVLGSHQCGKKLTLFKMNDGVISPTPDLDTCLENLNNSFLLYENMLGGIDLEDMFLKAIAQYPDEENHHIIVYNNILLSKNIDKIDDAVAKQLLIEKLFDEFLEKYLSIVTRNIYDT